jgi:hypothetical protein
VPVAETYKGKTLWDGVVEVYNLKVILRRTGFTLGRARKNDPAAAIRHVTVLHLHLIKSEQDAVRGAIAQEIRNIGAAEEN